MEKDTEYLNQLLALAKSGNEEAMEELFIKYKSIVTKTSRKYFLMGGENEDLISEGLIGLYKAIISFDDTKNDNFPAYAKTIIERKMISAIKSDNAQKNLMLNESFKLNNQGSIILENIAGYDDDETIQFTISSNKQSPETVILSKERTREMLSEIRGVLSPFEIKVIRLYLKGLNYTDIAKILNKSAKSIDNALNRIKTKLKFLKP